ncbi:SdpI family protein [Anaeromicrobium sediminis]|nr:SdpI family protein [Anaeromicrobium sediminis]
MKLNKIILFLIFISILGTLLVYNQLPDTIPKHWNMHGEIDAYGSKSFIFVLALLPLGMYLLKEFLPKIDPKRQSYTKHAKAFNITMAATIIFFLLLTWSTILISLGFNINMGVTIKIFVGILFMIIGNYMSQIRPNYFFGVKTPWTLANETVWKKTHRLSGFTFAIGGLILVFTSFLSGVASLYILIGVIAITVLIPTIYSYMEYKKIS